MSDTLSYAQANILKFLPDIILDEFIKSGSSRLSAPEIISCRTLLLTANILQFSKLTQTLLNNSHDGIEVVSDIHSMFVNILQEFLGKTGADFLKNSTDKFYIYWAVSPTNVDEYISDLSRNILY